MRFIKWFMLIVFVCASPAWAQFSGRSGVYGGGGSGTVNTGTASHLGYYATTGTAISDMGPDWTFATHTLTGGAAAVLDLSSATITNIKFNSSSFTNGHFLSATVVGGVFTLADGGAPGAITGGTANSVLFLGAGGVPAQDNPHFYYDPTAHILNLSGGVKYTGPYTQQAVFTDGSSGLQACPVSTVCVTAPSAIQAAGYSIPGFSNLEPSNVNGSIFVWGPAVAHVVPDPTLLAFDGNAAHCLSGAATFISCIGGGGVSSFSGDTVFASNSSSTGAVTLTLNTAGKNLWWGNNTGVSAAPGYQAIGTQDTSPNWYAAGGGTANAQTVILTPAVTAYSTGLIVYWKAAATSTSAATLAVNGLSPVTLQLCGNGLNSLTVITSGKIYGALYDGTYFQVFSPTAGLQSACIGGASFAAHGVVVVNGAGTNSPLGAASPGTAEQVFVSAGSSAVPSMQSLNGILTPAYSNATTGFTAIISLPSLPASITQHGSCDIPWDQATNVSTVSFGFGLSQSPASGGLVVWGIVGDSSSGVVVLPTTTITNTVTTAVASTITPGVAGTVYSAHFDFTLFNSTTASVVTLYGLTANTADALQVPAGAACYWHP